MANRKPDNQEQLLGNRGKAGPGRPKGSHNKITRDWVENHLRWRVDFDPRVLAQKMGKQKGKLPTWTLRDIARFPKDVAMCIESYDVVLGNLDKGDRGLETVVKIRWYAKDKPLELCARSLGMLKDRIEITEGLDDRKARLRAALSRTKTDE
jgi:hypothetical protein